MASSSEQTTTKQKVGLNRRTLIRTGTHVAWAVPAVAMVSPTPAFAASGLAALTLGGNPGTWSPGGLLFPHAGVSSCRPSQWVTQARRPPRGFRLSLRYPMDL
jgi:hypothetical protein